MLVSASYRTDIPAFHAEWFARRLTEGSLAWRNPYSGRLHRLALTPDVVEGFVFWSRNPAPFLPVLSRLAAGRRPFMLQMTLTGYPRPLEPAVPAVPQALALMAEVSRRFGRRSLVWRYDPLFLTSLTPESWQRENFARLARAIAPHADEVVFSFAEIYAKTRRNADRAAARHGFTWRDPEAQEKAALLGTLAAIAAEEGLAPRLCSQPELLPHQEGSAPGTARRGALAAARCIDAARLSEVAGRAISVPVKGNRPGCLCAESRDVGAYDSCAQGCVYCYAVQDVARTKARLKARDPAAESL